MNYPIKIKDKTIMFDDINKFLRQGQRKKAIEFIISETSCTENEAIEVIEDITHMKKLQSEKVVVNNFQNNRQENSNKYVPKCPTCGSTNIEKISVGSKIVGAGLFGLFSKTARSQFRCNNCGYKW